MKINDKISLIQRNDVYLYEIESCHYTILNNLGYELNGVDPENKKERNIKIGQMMKQNPRLINLLRKTTESVISDYLLKNKIKDDEIVIRQYDGVLLTKQLEYTNLGHIPLEKRQTFQKFIISIDRNKYIGMDNNFSIVLKGISNRHEKIDAIYKRLCKLTDLNKDSIFSHLQNIKDEILTSTDPELFGIPTKDGKFIIFLKGYGEITISKPTLTILDTNDIDRKKYFDAYISPFTKSIVFETVKLKER
jgi:hypothetical protein